jgi:5'-nucleotidase
MSGSSRAADHILPARSPLILITNDDGITSPGLEAAVRAAWGLGEIVVAAPDQQWSGAGRCMSFSQDGRIRRYPLCVDGQPVTAYQVGASPALVVLHAVLELVERQPALVIAGINYGENVGQDITGSGTVGAALQGAACGIPSLACSLQTPKEMHRAHGEGVDFSAAAHFTRLFARALLCHRLPGDAAVLKLDVPATATPDTPWRVTRVSRCPYYINLPRPRAARLPRELPPEGIAVGLEYTYPPNPEATEPDSDIYTLCVERCVSVTPLSLDLTARVDLRGLEALLRASA